MKKTLLLSLFTAVYAIFFSLGMACSWNLLGIALAFGMDGWRVIEQYPRFLPFCVITGLLSLIAIIAAFILNIKVSKKLSFSKMAWTAELFCAFAVSFPLAIQWIWLFAFLQKTL